MFTPPFLLYITFKSEEVSDKSSAELHKAALDFVSSKTVTKGSLYKEAATPFGGEPSGWHDFLALYQSDQEDAIDIVSASHQSESDMRKYELIQDFNPPKNPFPYLLPVEMQPSDVEDFDKWYREEHIPMLARVLGYRRCSRYRCEEKPAFLAIHEVDDLGVFEIPEAKESYGTEWTKKVMAGSKVFRARGWKIVGEQGKQEK